jgi:hypothetical protein
MSYFVIEDFRAGMDTRRMPVLSVPGSLLRLINGHINRGGEIEKRLAFVPQIDLPAHTFGLAAVGGTLYTFGSVESVSFPAGSPANLVYQRLQSASAAPMAKVLQVSAFSGKPYVIAQFDDGSIHHFFDGVRHAEFVEARARTSFTIDTGTAGGISATASFEVTGGINSSGDQILFIRAGTLPILNAPVQHNGSNPATAAAIAAAINAFEGDPDFSAVAAGAVVTITAVTPGTRFNGLALNTSVTGGFTIGSVVNFAGGVDNAVGSLTVDGVQIMESPVLHTGDNAETALLVAAAINEYESTPDYRAVAIGNKVNVIIQEAGAANNTKVLTIANTGDVATTPATTANFADGADLVTSPAGSETYLPGEFAKPAKNKMYSVAGSLTHYSGIEQPLEINDALTEAGFIDLATNAEGSERLTAIANYQQNLAIFSERTVQIWFVDVLSAGNQQLQVLNNTGAIAPLSVQEIGDSDVLYLSESGIRSLRARDSSNAASSSDIGNPIDTIILEDISADRVTAREARAVLEPRDGRYLLAWGNKVYVFSFFPASRVSAWSVYEPGFEVTAWAIIGRRLYCRGDDDKLYLLGGRDGVTYDDTEVEAFLPYLDASKPATSKGWQGLDLACEGVWRVEIAADPNNQDARQTVATVEETTFNKGHVAFQVRSTHLAVRMVSQNDGYAKIGAMAVHLQEGSQG